MVKDLRFKMPPVTAEIKLSVNPDRAAVFLDGLFVGHAGEFGGVAKSLLVAPGHRKITISLSGYQLNGWGESASPPQCQFPPHHSSERHIESLRRDAHSASKRKLALRALL